MTALITDNPVAIRAAFERAGRLAGPADRPRVVNPIEPLRRRLPNHPAGMAWR